MHKRADANYLTLKENEAEPEIKKGKIEKACSKGN